MLLSHRQRRGPLHRAATRFERGVTLIEAAFVTPIFFVLIFGVVEISLAMNDNLALAHTVRAGSRVASAAGADPYADFGILKAIARESAALPRGQVQTIVVYRATKFGDPPSPSCQAGNPAPTTSANPCNVYTAADFNRPRVDFGCKTGQNLDQYWCPIHRNVILTGASGPDFVGVWMKIEHPWVTNMFGSTLTLTDSSVIQLEPRERQ